MNGNETKKCGGITARRELVVQVTWVDANKLKDRHGRDQRAGDCLRSVLWVRVEIWPGVASLSIPKCSESCRAQQAAYPPYTSAMHNLSLNLLSLAPSAA